MKKIKLLFTINFINNGGPSKVLLNIINNLNTEYYDITILTIIDENDSLIKHQLKEKGIKIKEFKLTKRIRDVLKYKKDIINYIVTNDFDIIHTHGIVTTLLVASRKIKAYKITTIHNNMYEDYKYTYGNIKGRAIAFIHLNRLKKFDGIICCSKTSYDVIKNKFSNISYIRNGIDLKSDHLSKEEINKLRTSLQITNNQKVYLYCGVLTKLKRVLELIDLFNKYKTNDEVLLIVGDGNLLSEAKRIAKDNIIFTGYQKDVSKYYNISDVYISNSSSEGFSISVIEALQNGLHLLLSDIPSHKECFKIDDNFYIGEYFDDSTFREKKEILKGKYSVDNKRNIISFKEKYLSSKVMTEQYEEIYKRGCCK